MSDRPTPETDAFYAGFYAPEVPENMVAMASGQEREKMRQFERERDDAREAFVIATDEMVQARCRTREAIRESYEAREDLRITQEAWAKAKAERIEALRERDDAREKYTTLLTENMFSVHQLCKERDEAREKIKRQANRIRELEGSTNHAEGTPLTIARRERDEAREACQLAHDRLLRGDSDSEILNILAAGWRSAK